MQDKYVCVDIGTTTWQGKEQDMPKQTSIDEAMASVCDSDLDHNVRKLCIAALRAMKVASK